MVQGDKSSPSHTKLHICMNEGDPIVVLSHGLADFLTYVQEEDLSGPN